MARRTGLSVRALHHYDQLGLLAPARRTRSGHRLYDRADVERLQQIQSLRLMGLSLDEVKRLLDGAAFSPRQLITLHLARLAEQIAVQTRLAERLRALDRHLDSAETVSVDELCRLIEEMTTMEQITQYFTPEQLATLDERRTRMGEARAREVRDEWNEIIPAVRAAMVQDVDPASPEMLDVARRWKALVDEFTAGDPAIANAVRTMYEHQGPALQEKLGEVPTAEMFAYMGKAFAALRG
ncbi:MerR family transcriptional regulator [Gemmatimonadetes bacterium T265]|nr:MerR family transcriptional regulator [Gemmatimonadetes bacterium T265]